MIGPKGLAAGTVEVKKRADGSRELMSEAEASRRLGAMKAGAAGVHSPAGRA